MRLVTWNMNSLRLRLPLLQRLLETGQPDIICVQETKVPDALFPSDALREMGLKHQVFSGMKGYNGVAILSRLPLQQVTADPVTGKDFPVWCGRSNCRHIAARIETSSGPVIIHNFYVPAGGDIPDPEENPKFAYKLAFIDEAADWFQQNRPERNILVGDLNTAPYEHDVWSHKQLLKIVSHTPQETTRHIRWQESGFCDAMRHLTPMSEKLYTWWSYRNRDWKKSNRGRRLDHIWLTPDLMPALQDITILQEARDWPQPSDHVPVCCTLRL